MQYCEQCGAQINPNARFCPRCGAQLVLLPQPQAPASGRPPQPPLGYMPPDPATGPQTSPWGPAAALPRPGFGLAVTWSIFHVLAVAAAVVLVAALIEAGPSWNGDEEAVIVSSGALCTGLGLISAILYLVWLYKAWSAVPPQYRSTSPGAAVGLMFVPLFNLYWMFRATIGLSRSIERALAAQTPGRLQGAGSGVAIAACVTCLIPFVNFVLFLIWVNVANAGKNRMLRHTLAYHHHGPPGL